ncbi:FCD domain-containing protein [Pseudoglutamicibacter albus]|uniref:FadR/GntR family transcriptional regulator n=1 Tax=Pseudoglutamicibacter albus TaxID=98671 RepID=UPI001EF4E2A2|nr:FCD domain-containing protein [Pseudoglutamicibacter albus]MCG7305035.1 FCD domain-containing protein [Pseudoglutamicibacter albus]
MATADHDNLKQTINEGIGSSSHVLRNTVVANLGRRIVHGEIGTGSRFTLDDIQDHFDVSRTVARDAMRILESMGLMYAKRRVGLIVTGLEHWRVHDPQVITWRLSGPDGDTQFRELTELRRAIEPMAAAGAAIHAPREVKNDIIALAGQLRDTAASNDMEAFVRTDTEFHELIYRYSGNSLFRMSGDVIQQIMRRSLTVNGELVSPSEAVLDQHDALALAISSGSAERAREASEWITSEANRTAHTEREAA